MPIKNISGKEISQHRVAENRRHTTQMRKLKAKNYKEFQKEVKSNKERVVRMRDEYEGKIKNLDAELERKLVKIRKKHKYTVRNEMTRLKREVDSMKKSHTAQVGELKAGQSKEIDDLLSNHEKIIEDALQKFKIEKRKLET